VQASARVWLGVLTTLFGLLGSVVLFKGGSLVTGVTTNGWLQLLLIVLVGLVFTTAMLAIIAGGAATWGGLDDVVPSNEEATGTIAPVDGPPKGKVTGDQRWIGQRFFNFFLPFALESKATRNKLRAAEPPPSPATAGKDMPAWRIYQKRSLYSADRRRALLHASRNLGVITAGLIAVLAITAIIAGTISPAPTEVIVVYHGRFTCTPVSAHTIYTGVTQVVPVSSC